jgi:membrane-associated phospholipid phosphatase
MLGIAALTAFCISACIHFQIKEVLLITILILCNGLVASSRLHLKAHSNNELIVGFLIGLFPQLLLLFFWL